MIIGLGHQARVGKDTAAAILVDKYGFKRLAFADRLKAMALEINPLVLTEKRLAMVVAQIGWEEAKLIPEVRRFLQALGVAARDHLGNDVWVWPILEEMDAYPDRDYVITDVRFPNEFDDLVGYGATMVKLTRDGSDAGDHISETALADADWDFVIQNVGTLGYLELALRLIPGVSARRREAA